MYYFLQDEVVFLRILIKFISGNRELVVFVLLFDQFVILVVDFVIVKFVEKEVREGIYLIEDKVKIDQENLIINQFKVGGGNDNFFIVVVLVLDYVGVLFVDFDVVVFVEKEVEFLELIIMIEKFSEVFEIMLLIIFEIKGNKQFMD